MTGLIYIVIIALWVAVLIPMWLRRLDQVSEVRSTLRFSSAMQSLGSHRDYSAPRPAVRTHEVARAAAVASARQRAMAVRRAIVLATLSLLLASTLILAIASVLPKWVPFIFAALVITFLVAAAMTASQRTSAAPVARRTPVAQLAPEAVAAPTVVDDWAEWDAWENEGWEAVPTTLPTYVSAPRASAIPRPIDRSRPGEWTGDAMVEAAQTMRRHRVTFDDVDARAETAEIPVIGYGDDRRAVNE